MNKDSINITIVFDSFNYSFNTYRSVPFVFNFCIFNIKSFTIQAFIFPTTPDKGRQGIVTKFNEKEKTGYGLFIDENGCLSLEIGDGSQVVKISSEKKLLRKVWYLAVATFDAETKKVHLYQEPRVTSTNGGLGMAILNPLEETSASIESFSSVLPASNDSPLLVAASTLHNRTGRKISGGILKRYLSY